MTTAPTIQINIHMAGDLATAKGCLRGYCYSIGCCFRIYPATYIYTGGEEEGFTVGIVNYPRFPSTPEELWGRARAISRILAKACNQRSALIVGPETTEWIQLDPPGRRETPKEHL